MLSQMPTSALSFLSSSSKGLDGFFGLISVGIQMALTVVLAEFNTEFTTAVRATATVKLAFQPTKCVISNGTGFHPYVATMGSATIVLLVVSYMLLRAKGRDIRDGDPASHPSADTEDPNPDSGGQPPSPPEDPETASSPKKRRNRWALFLLIILGWTVLLSLGAALFIAYLVPTLRFPGPLQVLTAQTGRIIERCSASISALATHLSLHGQRYLEILLLALASHLACTVLSLPTRRVHRFILSWGPSISVPNMDEINEMRLWIGHHFAFLAAFQPIDVAMTLGPAVIHTCSMWLIFFLIAIYQIPRGIIRLGRHPLDWRHICLVLGGTIGITAIDSIRFTCFMATEYYRALAPDRKPFFWRYPFSLEAKYRIQYVYWDWFYEYQDQKAAQNKAFATLVFELPGVFKAEIRPVLELWCSLAWFQKFVIIAPAVLIYIYCDMNPTNLPEVATSAPRNIVSFSLG
ncbi:hypothetical protein C8R46DRAFT_1189313 [Mycena filopes]|nr:hypothetical protein C8R46DRAFT_1189313 [Mycena filopes]